MKAGEVARLTVEDGDGRTGDARDTEKVETLGNDPDKMLTWN